MSTLTTHFLHSLSEAIWRVAVRQADRQRAKTSP